MITGVEPSTTLTPESSTAASTLQKPFLNAVGTTTDANAVSIPIYFHEDWDTGIGGGLWSTGLAMSHYLLDHPELLLRNLRNIQKEKRRTDGDNDDDGLSVIELGSGNGLLSISLAAVITAITRQQQQNDNSNSNSCDSCIVKEIIITDDAQHLDLMQTTIDSNPQAIQGIGRVHAVEHMWGQFRDVANNYIPPSNARETTIQHEIETRQKKFDLVLGTDVVYRAHLYDIFITSILQLSHPHTVILVGVTMLDTTAEFFTKLDAAGFRYTRISNHTLRTEYRNGTTFGIFMIARRNDGTYCDNVAL